MIKWFKFCFLVGATAWEWQIGVIGGRIVHLWGGYWKWKFWQRFSFGIGDHPLSLKACYLYWKYRNVDPSVCCCGGTVGGIVYGCNAGCRSAKEYAITQELETE